MSIMLERLDYFPGEIIRGIMTISLKVPVQADRLSASLLAYRIEREHETDSDGKSRWVDRPHTVYTLTRELGGKGEYRSYDFPIEFVIPHDACPPPRRPPEGFVENLFHTLSSINTAPVHWVVHGTLEIPWKFPIKKRVQITVTRPEIPGYR